MKTLSYRPRRLRENPLFRERLRETALESRRLIAPLFIREGDARRTEVASMPGVFRLSIQEAVREVKGLSRMRLGGVLLFGIPKAKDPGGAGAYAEEGVIQRAVRAIKRAAPEVPVITDVCLCEYTDHGHCGILTGGPQRRQVDNDATLPVLAEIALSHARAGADLVAPSAMMDGQVGAIRRRLDEDGFGQVPIMSYAAKYASAFYGPFREAVGSSPRFGDRAGYQMDPPNAEEALREVALDIEEGADIIMVKPAMAYLDILRRVKEKFHWPTAAYQVSGEYGLLKAAAEKGWLEEERAVKEVALSIRRAGADFIITYYAKALAKWLE